MVEYERILAEPIHSLERLANWLGLEVDQESCLEYCTGFLDQGLQHSKFELKDVLDDPIAPPLVKDMYSFFVDISTGNKNIIDVFEAGVLDRWINDFKQLRSVLSFLDKQERQITNLVYSMKQIHSITNLYRDIPINSRSALNLPGYYADTFRDAAVAIEDKDLHKAYQLMSLAQQLRPHGPFINQKLSDYEQKLAQ